MVPRFHLPSLLLRHTEVLRHAEKNRMRRARDYSLGRHIVEQLLLRAFERRWLANLHYERGWHRPLRVWTETVRVPLLSALPPLRIAFASDFHAGLMTHPEVLAAACQTMAELQPDLLLLGGDYVSWDQRFIADLAPLIGAVPAPYGRYAVIGNHDVWADDVPIRRSLERHGCQVLVNAAARLPPPYDMIEVYGMDDPTAGQPLAPKHLPEASSCRLLLVHSPEGLGVISAEHYHVGFAGHTHGGQFVLPSGYPFALLPGSYSHRYAAGRYQLDPDRIFFVSRGVGYGDIPLRWNAPADILVCTLSG
jgi:predicted MPP superfamily phosphohydrolase